MRNRFHVNKFVILAMRCFVSPRPTPQVFASSLACAGGGGVLVAFTMSHVDDVNALDENGNDGTRVIDGAQASSGTVELI